MIPLNPPISGFPFGKAASYADFAATLPPEGVTLHELGVEDSGKTIYGLSVGDLNTKPVFFLLGGIHGNHEWPGAHISRHFMRWLVDPPPAYKGVVAGLLSRMSFYCIPCANPYGYEAATYHNSNDVNLNRNFDYNWAESGTGAAPFDQPETQIIRDLVQSLRPAAFLDLHIRGSGNTTDAFRHSNPETLAYAQLFLDCLASLRQTCGRDLIASTAVAPSAAATSRSWAASQQGRDGQSIITFLYEPPAVRTEEQQAYTALNAIFLASIYVDKWLRFRTLRHTGLRDPGVIDPTF